EVSPYAALPGSLTQAIAAAYDAKDQNEPFWRGASIRAEAPATFAVILPEIRRGAAGAAPPDAALESVEELEELEELREPEVELCARLKASVRTRSTPVILVSAVYRGWRYAHDARETFGADDYLEKPFHLPELLRRVEERLSGGANSAASSAKGDKLYQEGIDLLEQKKPAEARAVLEKAIKEEPFSPRAHFALARAMHDQGELFHAITAYERAVELR